MVHLWKVAFVGRGVVESAIPQVEQKMDVIRAIAHVPEPAFGEFEAAILGANYAKCFIEVESAEIREFLYKIVD